MTFSRCGYVQPEWYCVLRAGHDGPCQSDLLVDPSSLSDDERRALGLRERRAGLSHD